jgi:hypothetical protein
MRESSFPRFAWVHTSCYVFFRLPLDVIAQLFIKFRLHTAALGQ